MSNNVKWLNAVPTGRTMYARTSTTVPDEVIVYFTIISGAANLYVSDATNTPGPGNFQVVVPGTSDSASGVRLGSVNGYDG